MTLRERMQWVVENTGHSARGLSLKAGKSEKYVQKIIERDATRPDYEALRKVAEAAGVSFEWLLSGEGEPGYEGATHATKQATPDSRPELRVERDPEPALKVPTSKSPLERAIGLAFDPTKHDLRTTGELLAALGEIERKSFELDPGALIEPARRWLNAAHRLAARGEPITAQAVLYYLDVPRLGTEEREAFSALDREVDEKASTVVRGEGLAGLAEMQRELDESRKKKKK